jgi:hypothetical protein
VYKNTYNETHTNSKHAEGKIMKDALARVKKFLDERAKMHGIDPSEISTIHAGSEKETALTTSDLSTLLAAINARDAAISALLRDVVPHVRDTGHNAADREMAQAIHAARSLVQPQAVRARDEPAFSAEELSELRTLVHSSESANHLDRLRGRMEIPRFVERVGREKYDAMRQVLDQEAQ